MLNNNLIKYHFIKKIISHFEMIQLEWSNNNGYAMQFNWFLFSWNQSKRNKKKCTTFFFVIAQEFSLCFTFSINIIANYLTVKHSIWSKICHKKRTKNQISNKKFLSRFPVFYCLINFWNSWRFPNTFKKDSRFRKTKIFYN